MSRCQRCCGGTCRGIVSNDWGIGDCLERGAAKGIFEEGVYEDEISVLAGV